MKKKQIIVEFNVKADPDHGYNEYIDLEFFLSVLKHQHNKLKDQKPMVKLVGDSLVIFKYVECCEEDYNKEQIDEKEMMLEYLIEEADQIGYKLNKL